MHIFGPRACHVKIVYGPNAYAFLKSDFEVYSNVEHTSNEGFQNILLPRNKKPVNTIKEYDEIFVQKSERFVRIITATNINIIEI